MITGEAVNASVMAISFCDLHLLHKDDFQDIMAMNPTLKDVLIQHRAHVFDMQKNQLKHNMKAKRRKSTAFEERLGLANSGSTRGSDLGYTEKEKDVLWDLLHSIQDRMGSIETNISEVQSNFSAQKEKEAKEADEAYIKDLLSH